MDIVYSDQVIRVNQSPNYNINNPVKKVTALVEGVRLAAESEHYLMEHVQYLFPFDKLIMYGPSQPNPDLLDPAQQESKTDFQKQNVQDFFTTDTYVVRGIAAVGDWIGPFLRLSYRGGMDSKLSQLSGHTLGDKLQLYLKVDNRESSNIIVPYNEETDRYEVELWGYPIDGSGLTAQLDEKGLASLSRGELQIRPDLLPGNMDAFRREALNDLDMRTVSPDHAMHPILPMHLELAWSNEPGTFWDSQNGANYHYEFNMLYRGWDHFLATGISANPHGGLGFLEYRNLFSNYGRFSGSQELGRSLENWNQDAFGSKNHNNRYEPFLALDYIDLHILKPGCHIGLHRHRDNQEIFFLMEGQALMVIGDWAKYPNRERCLEIRMLRPGHMALLKSGQLHSLINTTDEDLFLLMFGGYD